MPKLKAKPEPKVREQHLLTENQRLIILIMSKLGGFSTLAVAKRIFHTDDPTDGEKACIAGFRARQGVKLRVWRDCESGSAQNFAREKIKEHQNASRVSRMK